MIIAFPDNFISLGKGVADGTADQESQKDLFHKKQIFNAGS